MAKSSVGTQFIFCEVNHLPSTLHIHGLPLSQCCSLVAYLPSGSSSSAVALLNDLLRWALHVHLNSLFCFYLEFCYHLKRKAICS